PKKKKTQLKPIARGFATTSVPKKVELAAAEASDEEHDGNTVSVPHIAVDEHKQGLAANAPPASTPEDRFESEWTAKHQERTEREILRLLKALEVDRRFSKTFTSLDLDSDLEDEIIELAKQDYSLGPVLNASLDSMLNCWPADEIDEPEEKALLSLGVTYGILRRIGVPQAVAEDCLAQMNGIDLDDAAVWLCMNRPELDIGPLLGYASPPVPDTTVQGAASHSNSPKMGAHSSPSLILPITDSNPDDNSDLDLMPDSQREQSSASAFWRAGSDSDTGSENDDDLDPNQQYAQLKLRIHAADISQKRRVRADLDSRVDSDLRTMRARLEKIKQNYLFREKEAEALFRAEKLKTDAAARTARLRGSTPQTSSPPSRPTKGSKSDVPQSAKLAAVDLVTALDGVDDDLFGAMLDTPATDSLTPVNISIASRNMALPKHWTGKVPRIHLQDAVTQMDKFASLAVEQVGGPSRLSKAGCTIRWSDGKVSHWEMTDVGCEDETQAIHFISIVALHALSCEVVPGFAPVGGSSSGRAFSFVRLLPNSFRSLWDELENHRKVQEEIQNSAVWCTLRALYMAKTSTNIPLASFSGCLCCLTDDFSVRHSHKPSGGTRTSEQVQQDWLARTLRPEYVAMQDHRTRLPIAQHRDEILRLMEANAVVVLSGETGCGKSSQLPQFILQRELEQGRNCNIICTEPRRISAISLAQRVSQELGDPPSAVGTASSLVGYSIRLESNTSRSTRLTYMTNGIALRMLEQGSGSNDKSGSFDDVTHVIIDEVHERSIDSDFLLIILRSLLPRRPDLRVILMSATLDADKISAYFNNCPTIHVPGRTFPVEACYLEDAVELCKWNVPEGSPYAKDVRDPRYKVKDTSDAVLMVAEEDDEHMDASGASLDASYSRTTLDTMSRIDEKIIPVDLIIMLLEVLCWKSPAHAIFSSAVLVFMPGIAEIRQLMDSLSEHAAFGNSSRFLVMPLHSTLSSQEQSDVFNIPPFGVRKIVISTNIAETGVTIPDVTCVIDTGKHRGVYDEKRQISRLVDTFITKSNAKQRRGRAGRVQEGLCFHLFSKQRHETQMPENPQPEMLRLSLAGLALRIKITNITLGATIEDVFLSALDPPTQINIQRAIASLVEVGALSNKETITPLGLLLSKLPIDVHLGKLLAVATTLGCLDMALTIAATISNGKSPFVSPFGHEQEAANAKRSFNLENNDFLTMHQVYSRRACGNSGFAHKFTRQNFLSHQTLHQIEELRQHLLRYLVDSSLVEADRELVSVLNRSRGGRGRVQFIAVPAAADRNGGQVSIQQAAIVAGLWPKVITLNRDDDKVRMRTLINNQAVAFHPTSVNFHRPLSDFAASNFLVYFTIMQSKRLYAWETGAAQDVSIVLLCGEGEFRSSTETFALDRNKVRFRAKGRTGVAIQHVRQRIAAIFATRMRGQPVTDLQSLRWLELALAMLRRKRAEDP
ncbi:P-loop containing nucleoside triphosphate hydrolase protein, partial [Auriculariales sp. MPI-PUGE-AT-0066]